MKFFLLAFLLLSSPAFGWKASLSLPRPAPVVDEVGLLDQASAAQLDRMLREIKSRSGVEVSVFVASSLRDLTIEEFSLATAEEWKLGRKKEDKALLFVIAPKERKMRLEVGYGMEGEITDAFSRQVLDNVVKPYFVEGRFVDGVMAGLTALQQKIPMGLQPADTQMITKQRRSVPGIFVLLILLLFFISFVSRLMGGGRSRGIWLGGGGGFGGLGGGGGGSWGGGGGGFGGGGSSSSW